MSCAAQPNAVHESATASVSQGPAPKTPAHVGATLDLARIGNGKMSVTLVQVIDPATIPAGMGGDPGKVYIATKLVITNTGTATIVGDANNDVSVVGSDEQSYRPGFATVSGCTNFTYGQFLLAEGESVTGCVSFALPPGVSPAKVRYAPSSGLSPDVGEWLIP